MLYLTSSTTEKNTAHSQNKFSSVNESGQLIEYLWNSLWFGACWQSRPNLCQSKLHKLKSSFWKFVSSNALPVNLSWNALLWKADLVSAFEFGSFMSLCRSAFGSMPDLVSVLYLPGSLPAPGIKPTGPSTGAVQSVWHWVLLCLQI